MISRRRFWFLLCLSLLPAPFLWKLAKIWYERPHLLTTWKYRVEFFHFPEDGQSVCVDFDGDVDCYSKTTRKKLSNLAKVVQRSGVVQNYGPLRFRLNTDKYKVIQDGVFQLVKGGGKWKELEDSISYDGPQIVFSPEHRLVTVNACNGVSQWDTRSRQCLWKTSIDSPGPLSPDGTFVVGTGYENRRDPHGSTVVWPRSKNLVILSARSGNAVSHLPFLSSCQDSGFTPDSRSYWMQINEDELRFYDVRTGKLLWRTKTIFQANGGINPHHTPDGELGIPRSNGFDFLDARTGKLKRHLNSPPLAQMEAWNFSPDGKQLWWSTPKHEIFWCDLS